MEHVKTGLAVVGGLAVLGSLIVVTKRFLEQRRDNQRVRTIARLRAELDASQQEITRLTAKTSKSGKPVRVYIDGCFDMMHFGHSNALRQARQVGTYLVVGLIGDKDIVRNKGSLPVLPMEERLIAIKSCKFVDEVIPNAPYDLTPEFTMKLKNKYNIDYIVHGDDPCITCDGKDAYETAKRLGMFKMIKRTEGISTTDLVGRMLLMNRDHHVRLDKGLDEDAAASARTNQLRARANSVDSGSELLEETRISNFLPTSRRIVQFSEGRAPLATDRVVYVTGSWDLFHSGHMKFLEKAAKLGDFLLVGISDDDTVNAELGGGFPIMNLHERALSVLSCRWVDEVIIGAPWRLTEDMINTMHISVVATSNVHGDEERKHDLGDAFDVARDTGILTILESESSVTAQVILDRVMEHRATFMQRYAKKHKSEKEYYTTSKATAGFIQEG